MDKNLLPNVPQKPRHLLTPEKDEPRVAPSHAGKIAFDLSKAYDMSTFTGRFSCLYNSFNPLMFFFTDKTILEAQKEVRAYESRFEAARNLGSQLWMTPEEVTALKKNYHIYKSAIHPDT